MRPCNICCIGDDFTGIISCCVIAYKCPEVRVIVLGKDKPISDWNSDPLPFDEPQLDEVVRKCRNRNLFFSCDYKSAVRDSDMIVLAIKVPVKTVAGREEMIIDFHEVEDAAKIIKTYSESDKLLLEKSDLSAQVSDKLEELLGDGSQNAIWKPPNTESSKIIVEKCEDSVKSEKTNILRPSCRDGFRCLILSNPEFTTPGCIVKDLLSPERVIIGRQNNPRSRAAAEALCELYEQWIPREKMIILSPCSTQLCKFVTNAFLAQKLITVNSLAILCEETGADLTNILSIVNKDNTIEEKHLNPTLGFDGLEDDVLKLSYLCKSFKLEEAAEYWQTVKTMKDYQESRFIHIIKTVLGTEENRTVTILGFSMKKSTFDKQNSPAVEVCKRLLEENVRLKIHDPDVEAEEIFSDLMLDVKSEKYNDVLVCSDPLTACIDSSAIILCTDRESFAELDFKKLGKRMKKPVVIDGLNKLQEDHMNRSGIIYYTIGSSKSFEKIKELEKMNEEKRKLLSGNSEKDKKVKQDGLEENSKNL